MTPSCIRLDPIPTSPTCFSALLTILVGSFDALAQEPLRIAFLQLAGKPAKSQNAAALAFAESRGSVMRLGPVKDGGWQDTSGALHVVNGDGRDLRRIPNLRKISINYRCNLDRVASDTGSNYVWSYKPNPAVLTANGWRPELARAEMVRVAGKARAVGAHVEFIMKDIFTVRCHPERLRDWARVAMDVSEELRKQE